jgi:hypothetical protein
MEARYKEKMQTVCWLILLTGAFPLWRAWQANRQTSLLQAVHWGMIAWAAWGLCLALVDGDSPAARAGSYLALCLTGCAGVAVLGARRPGVGPWNFVVAALLAVNLLPLAEGAITGGLLQLDALRLVCVAATIAVGIINYLPTRLWLASLLLLLGCTVEFVALCWPADLPSDLRHLLSVGRLALAFVPWVAYGAARRATPALSEFDRLWLGFRDRFGFVWAQRLREQFNRSAAHGRWPVILRWQGLRLQPLATRPEPAAQAETVETLRALMRRFGPEASAVEQGSTSGHSQ